jgi:6-phosphogluconolactonase
MRNRSVVFPTAESLAEDAARRFAQAAGDAVHARGRFVVALSGGSTPRGLYMRLAALPYRAAVPWSRVHVLWSDERCVPADHAASNYRMARETLLDHVPIPATNVHRMRGEDNPDAAARAYERILRDLLQTAQGPPRDDAGFHIDLVLLGLGEDGHTASLFPGSPAAFDGEPWVIAQRAAAEPAWRLTLVPAVINAAAEVLFLVAGDAKAAIVRRVFEGPRRPREVPAHLIAPVAGRLLWLLDAAAASDLGRSSS